MSSQSRNNVDSTDRAALCGTFNLEAIIGTGAYGVVLRASYLETGAAVAIKKIKLDSSSPAGISATTIREVTLLQELNHPNVVRLLDVLCVKGRVYLVFELLDQDLRQFISRQMKCRAAALPGGVPPALPPGSPPLPPPLSTGPLALPLEMIKDFTRQILYAMWYCHRTRVVHRDLKPGNVLIQGSASASSPLTAGKGIRLKIADFGLARGGDGAIGLVQETMTHEVVTLWYRAPEILLGDKHYTPAVDVWSIGCIVAEMVLGKALLPGDSDMTQLHKTFQLVGTPNEQTWPGVSSLKYFSPDFPVFPGLIPQSAKDRSTTAGAASSPSMAASPVFAAVPAVVPPLSSFLAAGGITSGSTSFASGGGVGSPLNLGATTHWASSLFPGLDPLGCDLIAEMLRPNPRDRISVADALAHPWLQLQQTGGVAKQQTTAPAGRPGSGASRDYDLL